MWRRNLDIPLQRDGSLRFLPWLIALMVYLAGLALAGTLALDGMLRIWDLSLSATMTVEIPAQAVTAQPADDASLTAAMDVLRATPGILGAEPVDRAATAKLVEPWLGTALSPEELALPRLIDLRIAPQDLDLAALRTKLAAAAPGAIVDDHRSWMDRLVGLGVAIESIAVGILALIGAACVFTVIFTTRAGLAVHREVIDLLHLMGARDGYIAGQFQREALWLGFKGGIMGLVLAVLTLLVLHRASASAEFLGEQASLLPALRLTPWHWASLLLLPVAASLIATVTARITVMRALARLP